MSGDGQKREPAKRKFITDGSPFDSGDLTHSILKALEDLGVKVDDQDALLARLKHVGYGLGAEDECAAILAWLGECELVHGLEQGAWCREDMEPIQIPDLFAVFRKGKHRIPVLIEVKTSEEFEIRFTTEYRQSLLNYGKLTGLPVLLAWKCRPLGVWMLLDVSNDEINPGGRIALTGALPNDLMNVLAGDFAVVPMPGLGIHFEADILGEKRKTPEGYSATLRISKCYIGVRGTDTGGLSESELSLAITGTSEEYTEEREGMIAWGHYAPDRMEEPGPPTNAQNLLGTVVGWSRKPDEGIAWRQVTKYLDEVMPKRRMEGDLSAALGRTVRYIFHLVPRTWPQFLPKSLMPKGKTSAS